MQRLTLSVPVPAPLLRLARRIKRAAIPPAGPNLLGDRHVEWSWMAANLPEGPGDALDFGPGESFLGLTAAMRGFRVTAVDLGPAAWPYRHPDLSFVQGDLLEMELPAGSLDLVLCCSTVEHVGLSGRYGVTREQGDGDLEAMSRLRRWMRPSASLLLTVPVGLDAVLPPFCRVYGQGRLPRLLEGFAVAREQYWQKDPDNRWVGVGRGTALAYPARVDSLDPLRNVHALGCFVLAGGGR